MPGGLDAKVYPLPPVISIMAVSIQCKFKLLFSITSLDEDPLFLGIGQFIINIPIGLSIIQYFRIAKLVPEQKSRIYVLIFGLIISIVGELIRSYSWIVEEVESDIGLVLLMIGVFIAMLAFTNMFHKDSEALKTNI